MEKEAKRNISVVGLMVLPYVLLAFFYSLNIWIYILVTFINVLGYSLLKGGALFKRIVVSLMPLSFYLSNLTTEMGRSDISYMVFGQVFLISMVLVQLWEVFHDIFTSLFRRLM